MVSHSIERHVQRPSSSLPGAFDPITADGAFLQRYGLPRQPDASTEPGIVTHLHPGLFPAVKLHRP
jgi:hypothetical protein